MSKKVKSQASSSRAAASTFGSFGGFSSAFSSQGREPSSITYVTEPPDLSQISEPQLVIAFKNFLKKDEVTRSKSLDDMRDYVSSVEARKGTLDDGFLEAWVRLHLRSMSWENLVTPYLFIRRLKYIHGHQLILVVRYGSHPTRSRVL